MTFIYILFLISLTFANGFGAGNGGTIPELEWSSLSKKLIEQIRIHQDFFPEIELRRLQAAIDSTEVVFQNSISGNKFTLFDHSTGQIFVSELHWNRSLGEQNRFSRMLKPYLSKLGFNRSSQQIANRFIFLGSDDAKKIANLLLKTHRFYLMDSNLISFEFHSDGSCLLSSSSGSGIKDWHLSDDGVKVYATENEIYTIGLFKNEVAVSLNSYRLDSKFLPSTEVERLSLDVENKSLVLRIDDEFTQIDFYSGGTGVLKRIEHSQKTHPIQWRKTSQKLIVETIEAGRIEMSGQSHSDSAVSVFVTQIQKSGFQKLMSTTVHLFPTQAIHSMTVNDVVGEWGENCYFYSGGIAECRYSNYIWEIHGNELRVFQMYRVGAFPEIIESPAEMLSCRETGKCTFEIKSTARLLGKSNRQKIFLVFDNLPSKRYIETKSVQ